MLTPGSTGRPHGARERLIVVTYGEIAEWAGLSVNTVRQYASRGQYDPRNLISVLQWCNARRATRGLPPIGQSKPPETPESATEGLTETAAGGYDPLTGSYT